MKKTGIRSRQAIAFFLFTLRRTTSKVSINSSVLKALFLLMVILNILSYRIPGLDSFLLLYLKVEASSTVTCRT